MKSFVNLTQEQAEAAHKGTITQHRVPIKPQPRIMTNLDDSEPNETLVWKGINITPDALINYCPYSIGEQVYIRETFGIDEDDQPVIFYKGETPDWGGKWTPSIHMPLKAARTIVTITDIRAQRIQDINKDQHDEVLREGYPFGYDIATLSESPVVTFSRLWNSIYPGSWERNDFCWVFAYTMGGNELK